MPPHLFDIRAAVLDSCAAIRAIGDELTELRAYRDRTEAALLLICNGITLNALCGGPLGQLTSILRDAGLWRDAKEGAS